MQMQVSVTERRMSALHSFPKTLDSYDYRAICLFFACIIYSIFGSPTPDQLSFYEILIGGLLCLSIGIGRARDVLINGGVIQGMRPRFWKSAVGHNVRHVLRIVVLVQHMHTQVEPAHDRLSPSFWRTQIEYKRS